MIFDRISLVSAYKALKHVNENDGRVSDILFNKQVLYGTKTKIRFKDLADLKSYITVNFPYYHFDPNCDCGTDNESILNLLSFNVHAKDVNSNEVAKHAIFVNNIRRGFESGKSDLLNNMSVKQISDVFAGNLRLEFLKENYVCESYVQRQGSYVDPCDYIEVVSNDFYDELISKHYYPTQNYDN